MSDAAESWPVLTGLERRILGVLIEKQKTTPDTYPMSVNGILVGCNQKSNRDPVMTVDDVQVEDGLESLLNRGLVARIDAGRVEKHRHLAYECWQVDKEGIAVLAELLLRGPQTEGELRGRVSRMEPLADLPALRAVLAPLVQRGLAVWLSPEGRRGAQITHGFHDREELARLRADVPVETGESSPARPRASDELAQLRAEIADLRRQVDELRKLVLPAETASPAPP